MQHCTSTPVSTELGLLLTLYLRANSLDVYCNYMEGLVLLTNWLFPDKPRALRADAINYKHPLHRCIAGYELQQIAVVTGHSMRTVWETFLREVEL